MFVQLDYPFPLFNSIFYLQLVHNVEMTLNLCKEKNNAVCGKLFLELNDLHVQLSQNNTSPNTTTTPTNSTTENDVRLSPNPIPVATTSTPSPIPVLNNLDEVDSGTVAPRPVSQEGGRSTANEGTLITLAGNNTPELSRSQPQAENETNNLDRSTPVESTLASHLAPTGPSITGTTPPPTIPPSPSPDPQPSAPQATNGDSSRSTTNPELWALGAAFANAVAQQQAPPTTTQSQATPSSQTTRPFQTPPIHPSVRSAQTTAPRGMMDGWMTKWINNY